MEHSWSLRPAGPSDQSSIRRLVSRLQLNPMGIHWQHFLIALDSAGSLIGMGQVKQHKDGSRELASIGVVPAHRGEGIARLIIENLLARETVTLYLTCRLHNGPLYQKFGFHALDDPEQMPPYFRRIYRMAQFLQNAGLPTGDLLVMERKSGYDQQNLEGGS